MNKEQQQVLVLVGMFGVIALVVFHFFVASPGMAKSQRIKSDSEQMSVKLREYTGTASKLPAVKEQIQNLEEDISKMRKLVPSVAEFDFFKNNLRDMAAEYEIRVVQDYTTNIDPEKKLSFKKDPSYTEKQTLLNLSTGYHKFGSFLNRIENISPFRFISNVTMSKSGQRGGEDGGQLSVKITIVSLMNEFQNK